MVIDCRISAEVLQIGMILFMMGASFRESHSVDPVSFAMFIKPLKKHIEPPVFKQNTMTSAAEERAAFEMSATLPVNIENIRETIAVIIKTYPIRISFFCRYNLKVCLELRI